MTGVAELGSRFRPSPKRGGQRQLRNPALRGSVTMWTQAAVGPRREKRTPQGAQTAEGEPSEPSPEAGARPWAGKDSALPARMSLSQQQGNRDPPRSSWATVISQGTCQPGGPGRTVASPTSTQGSPLPRDTDAPALHTAQGRCRKKNRELLSSPGRQHCGVLRATHPARCRSRDS